MRLDLAGDGDHTGEDDWRTGETMNKYTPTCEQAICTWDVIRAILSVSLYQCHSVFTNSRSAVVDGRANIDRQRSFAGPRLPEYVMWYARHRPCQRAQLHVVDAPK